MSSPKNPLEWAAKTEEDFTVAHVLLRCKIPLTASSCFHAQQCAEKYLKGILVARNTEFPKIHDLLQILDLCEQAGVFVPIDEDALDRLSKYAVTTRYPGNAPTVDQARDAIETAKTVRKFARKFLNVK
ncbi:MAG: HEPN domain-containing protein [Anaerolineae bacterium]|nr:HEPN domain-containing protein [Anaerolineae bacterium]